MLMEVTLPENAIFAQPLLIKAKDSRLGGYLTPTVGVGTIDMVSKIPWFEKKYDEYGNEMLDMDESGKAIPPKTGHPSTYRPPGDNMVSADALAFEDPSSSGAEGVLGAEEDVIARAARKLRENRLLARDEENIATLDEEMSIEELIQEKIKIADTGAGIFGALTHMKAAKAKKYKKMVRHSVIILLLFAKIE